MWLCQANGRAALVLRLKRLRALDAQARLRAAVEREQQDIMNMPDRSYRKFARQCWRQRMESARAVRPASRLNPLHPLAYLLNTCSLQLVALFIR